MMRIEVGVRFGHSTAIAGVVCVLLFCSAGLCQVADINRPPAEVSKQGEVDDKVLAVAHRYQSNRESFKSIRCEYNIIDSRANSVEDALLGKVSNSITCKITYVASGDKTLFIVDPSTSPQSANRRIDDRAKGKIVDVGKNKKAQNFYVIMPFQNLKYIGDSKYQLRFDPLTGVANVHDPNWPDVGISDTPFDFGVQGKNEEFSLFGLSQKVRSYATSFMRYEGVVKSSGKNLLSIAYGIKPNNVIIRFLIDPLKGYSPVEMYIYRENLPIRRLVVTESREFDGDRWFPLKASIIFNKPDKDGKIRVRQFVVTSLHVDGILRDEDFSFEIPSGARVRGVSPLSTFRLRENMRISIDKLEDLLRICKEAEERRKADPNHSSVHPKKQRSYAIVLVLLAPIVAIFFVLAGRRYWKAGW